jgi:hypothetical protein
MCSEAKLESRHGDVDKGAGRVEADAKREGAQQGGTGKGLGGIKGRREDGRRRKLAERRREAVVKVIAKATAKRSCKAVCG